MQKKAFTLVELLVVLSIIALLMGILMPALQAARRSAYKTACKQNLHGCAVAFRMYIDDNRNTMPFILNMPKSTNNPEPNSVSLYASLKKYISGPEALKCPADKWPERNSTYFREEGSSYEYNIFLAGRKIEDSWFAKRFGTSEVWILHDYDGFHGKKVSIGGERNMRQTSNYSLGSFMYLYADTLVADRTRSR